MKTPLPDADASAAKGNKGTGRTIGSGAPGDVLSGGVLRMWRDRPGQPDTAVDIGAAPGTPVVSPVTGTVVLVKRYHLYGKYPDVQIHIQPDGYADVDCVLIHIEDPKVKAGDRVVAGMTPLGAVRRLSDRINHQLGHYTTDAGDHVHLQLNDSDDPSYKGLKGAVAVSGS
jgi:murein DD-endopeptidase MepM/ murein hydrolase activator NlpD